LARKDFDIIEVQKPIETLSADASGVIVVKDAALLFGGTFERAGRDLIIQKEGSDPVRIEDYFASGQPADLSAENGSILRGDLVETLAGPLAPGQYAQAGIGAGATPIGQVETLEGVATVQRTDGTVETLQVGTMIFEKDLLQTQEGATLSVTFLDGTIFTLASSSRMVIDALIYDPSSADNSGAFSLIQGGFVFIAGQVAKTGGMDVSTPSSTMGIRGTTVVVETETRDGIEITEVTLVPDPDGDIGRIVWRDNADQILADITETDVKWSYSTQDGVAREIVRNGQDALEDGVLVAEAFAAFEAANLRVQSGDAFVTLGDATPTLQNGFDGVEESLDFEADTTDAPQFIDPGVIEVFPETGTDTTQPFDDGNLIQSLPDALQTVSVQGPEDSPFSISGTLDLGGFEGIVQSIAVATGPSNGVATIDPDGAFTFVPEADFNGTDFFTFVLVDESGGTTEGRVEINVLPVNDAPEATDLANFISEDGVLSGPIAISDVDGDDLVFSVAQAPTSGVLVVAQNGTYSYVPDPDFFGSDTFAIAATDPFGESATSNVTVIVSAQADAPTIIVDPEQSSGEIGENGAELSLRGVLSARDADPGDVVLWSGDAVGTLGAFVIDAQGAWTYTLDPQLADPLGEGATVQERFVATATDQTGLTSTVTVEITVTGANDGPVLLSTQSDAEGALVESDAVSQVSGQLRATDADAGETVSWAGVSSAAFGVFALSADGAWTYTLDNSLADALAEGQTAIDSFEAVATEPNGETLTQVIEVTITGTNDAPLVAPKTFFQAVAEGEVSGALSAVDLDGPTEDLTFALGSAKPQNGEVVVAADGAFVYVPNAGFVGVDGFEYTVTDANGDQVFAQARVSVESDPNDASNQDVNVSISDQTEPDLAAGVVTVDVDGAVSEAVNIALVLDRSGSIGPVAWSQIIEAAFIAVDDLRAQVAETDTTVDVQVITYANNVRSWGPFDLTSPDLSEALNELFFVYRGGSGRLELALDDAQDFFSAQPVSETNRLLLVTDGLLDGDGWIEPFAALTDASDGFDVTATAVGFGENYEDGNLDLIDPNAVFASDAVQLADAISGIPLFSPELVALEILLETDDVGPVEVLDLDRDDGFEPGLIVEGTDVTFPLAAIEDIAEQLGETNQFTVSALFDTDGITADGELEVVSSKVLAKAQGAQVISGQDTPELLFGSDAADQIEGAGGGDVILAFDGDDTIDAGSGADTVMAGAGDDLIVVADLPELGDVVDGGAGRDTLRLEAVGEINAMIATLELSGIEVLDIANGQDDVLQLDFETIAELSDTSDGDLEALLDAALPNAHSVLADASDTLVLDGGGVFAVSQTDLLDGADGGTVEIWSFTDSGGNVLATLGVDSEVEVTASNVVA